MSCELCNLEEKTKWYHKDREFIICDCLTCKIPMIVYRKHTMKLSINCLRRVTFLVRHLFGDNAVLRLKQRKVPDHWHAHILAEDE